MILGWGHTLKALKSTVQGTVWDDKLHLRKLYQVNIQAIAEYYIFKDTLPYFFQIIILKRFGIPYWEIHP